MALSYLLIFPENRPNDTKDKILPYYKPSTGIPDEVWLLLVGFLLIIFIAKLHSRAELQQENKRLFHAVQTENEKKAMNLISEGISADGFVKGNQGMNSLHLMAYKGMAALLEHALKTDQELNLSITDDNGKSVYHYAAEAENAECLLLLLKETPKGIHGMDYDERLPLHTAAALGHTDCVREFIRADKEKETINHRDYYGKTPLHYAIEAGAQACGELLLEAGANAEATDEKGDSPMHYAIIHHASREFVKLLMTYTKSPIDFFNQFHKNGKTLLHFALEKEATACLQELLNTPGVNIGIKDNEGKTVLHHTAEKGQSTYLAALLKTPGANALLPDTDKQNKTALHYAAAGGHAECIKLLIEHLDTTNNLLSLRDSNGKTPLHVAAEKGQAEVIDLLFPDPYTYGENMYDNDFSTPLHYAAHNGHAACIAPLLKKENWLLNSPDSLSKSPLHYAAAAGHADCVKRLIEAGADLYTTDISGATPLQLTQDPRCRLLLSVPQHNQ